MIVTFIDNNTEYKADLSKGIEIGIPIQRGQGVRSFDIDYANYATYQKDGFVGNKNHGGSCNLETITFTPHGNGTHTECFGHISIEENHVNKNIHDEFMMAQLFTASTNEDENRAILDFSKLVFVEPNNCKCLIVRTLPNDNSKIERNYSGEKTPFISPQDMQMLVDVGIEHLVIDLPSVDPEWDEGKLLSHHIFWNYPDAPRTSCSITEFAYIPNKVLDGVYVLKLNIAHFVSDASPSRPIIYPLTKT